MTRFILPALITLLAVLVYGFYAHPLYVEVQDQRMNEAELKAALVEADTARAQLDAIAKRYEGFPPDATEKLAEILPEKIDPIRLLIETTTFLERNGFPAKGLTISVDQKNTESNMPYRTHDITFSISASYDSFRQFLHILERSLALRDLSAISFTSAPVAASDTSVGPELAVHEYNIRVVGYSLQ